MSRTSDRGGDRSMTVEDIEPLPQPYRGTIRNEDRAHSTLTFVSPVKPLSRPAMVTPPPNRSQNGPPLNELSPGLRRAETCPEGISSPDRVAALQQRWIAQQMRCLTLQIHQFASDPSTECVRGRGNLTGSGGNLDSFPEEEKKADEDEISFSEQTGAQASVELAWSSLENAVQMIMEHCRLAQEEAKESQQGEVQAIAYKERALAAEGQEKELQDELREVSDRAAKLSRERKVLVREVKSLRRQLEISEQKNVWRQVESYVVRALTLHESQLTRRKADTESDRSLTSRTDSDDAFSAATLSAPSVDEHEEAADREQGKEGSQYVVVAPCQFLDEPQRRATLDDRPNDTAGEHLNCASAVPAPAIVPPQAASTSVVRSSLGFGGHVALGFGRGCGKARQAITPKVVPSKATPTTKTEEEQSATPLLESSHDPSNQPATSENQLASNDTTTPPNNEPAATKSVARIVPQQSINPFTGYRSRVNSGEMFGSTVKKFLQNGSNSIAGALSTATGRTSPSMSAGEAATTATSSSCGITPQTQLEFGCSDDKLSSITRPNRETTEACTDSPVHSASCSVPGDIVANLSKDVSYLGSPVLLTPSLESPSAGSSLMLFELDCDPRILRSLSLPFAVRREPSAPVTALADEKTSHGSDDAMQICSIYTSSA